MKQKGFALSDFQLPELLSLMDIYLSEWKHRDELLWKQVFTYFYATLLVLFLPNIADFLNITLPNFPNVLFPIAAFGLSIIFLYVSIGYAKRLEASGRTYQKLIDLLPRELRRTALTDPSIRFGRFFSRRMSIVVCWLMFFGLLILSVIMIVYNLK